MGFSFDTWGRSWLGRWRGSWGVGAGRFGLVGFGRPPEQPVPPPPSPPPVFIIEGDEATVFDVVFEDVIVIKPGKARRAKAPARAVAESAARPPEVPLPAPTTPPIPTAPPGAVEATPAAPSTFASRLPAGFFDEEPDEPFRPAARIIPRPPLPPLVHVREVHVISLPPLEDEECVHIVEAVRQQSRLASKALNRHVQAIDAAEAAANAVDRAIAAMWADLLKVLRTVKNPWEAYQHATRAMRGLDHRMITATAAPLEIIATATRKRTTADILYTTPLTSLAHAAAQKRLPRRLHESRLLREDLAPGAANLFLHPHVPGYLGTADLLRLLRDPSSMTRAEQLELFASILFPTPPKSAIDRVVYGDSAGGLSWMARLQAATKLAEPAHVADVVSRGYAAGKTQREIAKDLLPIVQNVRSSARRIARTEGLRIAGSVQMACHEQLGDLVIGYTLHATDDENVRPWHWKRNGQVYYANPAPGQKGYRQLPRPPMEPEDPAERPPGTPQLAHNCRCFTTPVLRPVGSPRQAAAAGLVQV